MTQASRHLQERRAELAQTLATGTPAAVFQAEWTALADEYLREVLETSRGTQALRADHPFAVLAVGGYGRRELDLHSDIDVLFLFEKGVPETAKLLVDEILMPLWDLRFEVGYAMRTLSECEALARNTFEVLTSLLDARFVHGEQRLHEILRQKVRRRIIPKTRKAFGLWLDRQDEIRMATFGDASYLLEPHLKEGLGGLRDYHHILWLAKFNQNIHTLEDLVPQGILSLEEYTELRTRLDFLWQVRNQLHRLAERKNDRLSFEYQETIAACLGSESGPSLLAVEQFLGRLHSTMASIKALHGMVSAQFRIPAGKAKRGRRRLRLSGAIDLREGELHFVSEQAAISEPRVLMDIFALSARYGHPLAMEAKRSVRRLLYLVDEDLRTSSEMAQAFREILRGPFAFQGLDQMFETEFLETYLPEFKAIRDRVQFDAFHIFPVGRHSLKTVDFLKRLPESRDVLLVDLLAELDQPEILLLAGLLHDIGKFDPDHAVRGATIAAAILERMQWPREAAEEVLFLIRQHLLLVVTALRRDLNDEDAVLKCAQQIVSPDRLKRLLLLTWADSQATGPKAWSPWTASLVQELFFKVLHVLEQGEWATADSTRRLEKTLAEVRRRLSPRFRDPELAQLLETMPVRYLLSTPTRDILRHVHLQEGLRGRAKPSQGDFALEIKPASSGEHWNITFMGRDRIGLFADLAGAMALHNINVLSAHLFTWHDGTVVDLFRVSNPPDPLHPHATWERLEQDLKRIFCGQLSLSYRLSRKAAPSILTRSTAPPQPPHVVVDNAASDAYTLVEVFADDRVGLLYTIARALLDLRLDIQIAKIGTKADQVADIFYVRDAEGQKVDNARQADEIRNALLHHINTSQPVPCASNA